MSLRAQDAPVDDDYDESEFADGFDDTEDSYYNKSEENKEVTSEYNRRQEESRSLNEPRYAGRVLSRADLIGTMGHPVHSIDKELIRLMSRLRVICGTTGITSLLSMEPDVSRW